MKTEIEKFNPCVEAVEYRNQFDTFQKAWEQCPRGDWMLWLAQTLNVDIKTLTLAKAHCANTVRYLMKDKRSTDAIDVAIRFGKGKATREELDVATADAADAADAAVYTATDAAVYAAVYAAGDAAGADTHAADAAGDAAGAAAVYAAIDAAAHAGAKKKNQIETANICRKYLTKEVYKKLNL